MAKRPRAVTGVYEREPGSGMWNARYRVNGKLVRKSFGRNRGAAIEWVERARTVRRTGEGSLPATAKRPVLTLPQLATLGAEVRVTELCDLYLQHVRDRPDKYRDQINPPRRVGLIRDTWGERPAESLKPHDVEGWLSGLQRERSWSPATVNKLKNTLSAIYRYGKSKSKVSTNPARDVESWEIGEPIQRYLSENEETKLRKVLNRWVEKCAPHHRLKRLYLRSHAIELTVAICTGMRKGNQYRFRWSNVDFESRTIYLPKSETKQGRAHVLPMIDDVYNALIELRQIQDEIASIRGERDGGKKVQRIRMQSGGRVFDIAEPREWWAKAVKEAKIPHIRWHDLRHTTASRMVQSRKTLKEAGDALGHSSPNTTQRYAHLDVSHLHDAMSVLNTGRHNQTA